MPTYTKTKKLWSKWYQKRKNYTKATNQAKHIKMSKFLVETYGHRMAGCRDFCEFGVGSGRNIYHFHAAHPEWTYKGNDINPDIHSEIKSMYPDLLSWASIEIADTLSYLKRDDLQTDIAFTHGHLMHLPNKVINEVCNLIAKKTEKYILLYEAYLNGPGVALSKRFKYRKYRFSRVYEERFPGFVLEEKHISSHPTKKGIRQGTYFFKKAGLT